MTLANATLRVLGLGVLKVVERGLAGAAEAKHRDLIERRGRRIRISKS